MNRMFALALLMAAVIEGNAGIKAARLRGSRYMSVASGLYAEANSA